MKAERRPFPVVLAAPSGAGKTTLARALVERRTDVVFALSATTRPPRTGEQNEVDYRFVTDAEFAELRRSGELLESARVHEHWYGTLRASVTRALDSGSSVVLDIDVQGARRIRDLFPESVFIFVLPPSPQIWRDRLTGRGTEGEAERRVRMGTALKELRAVTEFDYVVVNDDLGESLEAIEAIVDGERWRRNRWNGLDARIGELERVLVQYSGG
ncbi:MAG: guanylate kinase [Gemmatimonadota bacterium]|jgi:guanylate kinase